jgi:hypothetical protein
MIILYADNSSKLEGAADWNELNSPYKCGLSERNCFFSGLKSILSPLIRRICKARGGNGVQFAIKSKPSSL